MFLREHPVAPIPDQTLELGLVDADLFVTGDQGVLACSKPPLPLVHPRRRCEQLAHLFAETQEAKARDAQLIGVAPECADAELFDTLLPVPVVDELLSPLLTVIPMHLLSHHIAAHRGLDVDQPRNLAKSVTVE